MIHGHEQGICTVAQREFQHQNWLEKSETKPVRYISLHYCAATGCQVADAGPRVECAILELRLPANYKPRQHAPIKDATLSVC